MKNLIVLRGAPGCGKSTFIEKWNLKQYTLCGDSIRELFESPVMDNEHGKHTLSQNHDTEVWGLLLNLLEQRMSRGELCVVDATHSRPQDFQKYKKFIEKYRYRAYCVSFADVPIDVCKKQNLMRPEYKHVPEEVIDKMYARMQSFDVQGYFKVVNHNDDETIRNIVNDYKPFDADKYSKVVVFGDIHGCFQPLKEYFDANPFDDNNLYVFTGDYTDRGIQNKEVVEWLLQHYEKKNIILLEGNHERWVREYANGDYDEELKKGEKDKCKSSEFFYNTAPQLADFDKKDLRQLCRSFQTIAFFKFDGKRYFVNHTGVGFLPEQLLREKASQFIYTSGGNGTYNDPVDQWFEEHELERNPDLFQIHAHRNTANVPIRASKNSFNLCDTIEAGGNLRILEITKD
jgi:predicted kinase